MALLNSNARITKQTRIAKALPGSRYAGKARIALRQSHFAKSNLDSIRHSKKPQSGNRTSRIPTREPEHGTNRNSRIVTRETATRANRYYCGTTVDISTPVAMHVSLPPPRPPPPSRSFEAAIDCESASQAVLHRMPLHADRLLIAAHGASRLVQINVVQRQPDVLGSMVLRLRPCVT